MLTLLFTNILSDFIICLWHTVINYNYFHPILMDLITISCFSILFCSTECSFRFSREGLGVNTSVSTMYFTTTMNGSVLLYSAATNDQLHIVHALSNIDISSSCKIAYLQALTASSWVNISHSGVILEESNGKNYVKVGNSHVVLFLYTYVYVCTYNTHPWI